MSRNDIGLDTPNSRTPLDRTAHDAGECTPESCPLCLEIHERRIKHCRSCRAPIIWFRTAAGKQMPVDADTVAPGELELDLKGGHVSHFATCPNANTHRRR